ncbi:hypothetical protein K438DRAFT_1754227 [Mycena galopus ATCC 62051]|nr:hypothetical protein K438DRAFT_1754227 [Mycena galopus ATCC 62051]
MIRRRTLDVGAHCPPQKENGTGSTMRRTLDVAKEREWNGVGFTEPICERLQNLECSITNCIPRKRLAAGDEDADADGDELRWRWRGEEGMPRAPTRPSRSTKRTRRLRDIRVVHMCASFVHACKRSKQIRGIDVTYMQSGVEGSSSAGFCNVGWREEELYLQLASGDQLGIISVNCVRLGVNWICAAPYAEIQGSAEGVVVVEATSQQSCPFQEARNMGSLFFLIRKPERTWKGTDTSGTGFRIPGDFPRTAKDFDLPRMIIFLNLSSGGDCWLGTEALKAET